MFEGIRAPFAVRPQPEEGILTAGAWVLRICGILALAGGLLGALFALSMWMAFPTDRLFTSIMLIQVVMFALTGGIMASIFGTTLLRWEERAPQGRSYAAFLGWFLIVGALFSLLALVQGVMESAVDVADLQFWAPGLLQLGLGVAFLVLAYHPETRAAMAPDSQGQDAVALK